MANSKGVAIAKRANIDKAQTTMLGAVCAASLVLGVTIVGVIYFAKVIGFNRKLKTAKEEAAASYESVQNGLTSVKAGVEGLMDNEYLNVVARSRAGACNNMTNESIKSIEDEAERLATMRTCTALRVVLDAMPSTLYIQDASKIKASTMSSLEQLLNWSGVAYEKLSGADAGDGSSEEGNGTTGALRTIDLSISLEDEPDKIFDAIAVLESSLRPFDAQSITLAWSGENEEGKETLELTGSYRAYYSVASGITTYKKTVCADKDNEKCPGDGNVKQDYDGGGE